MKKKFLALCMTVALIICSAGTITAFAKVSLAECDRCFQAVISGLLPEDEAEGNSVSAERKPLYDITLEQLGCVYEFETVTGEGYAVIICDEGEYVAQEFVPNGVSPYKGVEGLCVYVNAMTYLESADGALYDIATGAELSQQQVTALMDNAVLYKNSGIATPEYATVEVPFTSRSTDIHNMSINPPSFTGPGLSGGCAAVAGGNILGYFDRYYEELIPNHSAGYEYYGYYIYNLNDTYVDNSISQLYNDMQGNANGISEANFKSGMQIYCSRVGLSCDFLSLMNSGKLNYGAVKTSMKANKPVVLLLSTYNICEFNASETVDKFHYELYSGNHVMVGFSFNNFTYNKADGSTENLRFIGVATGFTGKTNAYFNIDYCTNINSAYGVYIH